MCLTPSYDVFFMSSERTPQWARWVGRPFVTVAFLADLPFSVVFDTLFLPYDLWSQDASVRAEPTDPFLEETFPNKDDPQRKQLGEILRKQ